MLDNRSARRDSDRRRAGVSGDLALVEEIGAKGGDAIVQSANVTGDENVTAQIAGSGNVVRR